MKFNKHNIEYKDNPETSCNLPKLSFKGIISVEINSVCTYNRRFHWIDYCEFKAAWLYTLYMCVLLARKKIYINKPSKTPGKIWDEKETHSNIAHEKNMKTIGPCFTPYK